MLLDILIIGILVLSGVIGYKKGLVGILVSVVSLVLSIILAVCLQTPLSKYLYNETSIGGTVESFLENMIRDEIKDNINIDDNNKFIGMFIENNAINDSLIKPTAQKMTTFVLKGLSFVLIFVIVFIVCYILQMILNIVFNLPILNSVNKIGGVSLNVLKNLFKIWLFLAIISLISFLPMLNGVNEVINSSIITKFLYNNNLIITILKTTLHL